MLINGLDQKPIDKIKKSVINKKSIPVFKPKTSPSAPTINGTMAPPAIPVTKIPEKEPCASATEFSAKDIIIDHIVEIKKPIKGKAIKACSVDPKSAEMRKKVVPTDATIKTFLLSKNFNSRSPRRVPKVIIPQKFEIVLAP